MSTLMCGPPGRMRRRLSIAASFRSRFIPYRLRRRRRGAATVFVVVFFGSFHKVHPILSLIIFSTALEDQFTLRYSIGLLVTHPPKVCVDVMYVTPLRQHVACKRGRQGNNERQRGTGEDERGTASLRKFWVILLACSNIVLCTYSWRYINNIRYGTMAENNLKLI